MTGRGRFISRLGVDKAVTAGQNFSVSKTSRTVSSASQKPVQVTVTTVMEETETVYAPEVVWVESCPFSKDEGKNGRGMYQSGRNANHHPRRQDYSFTEACWKYKDTAHAAGGQRLL
nr:hypothetical protein [Klebsiella pneumoniae]